MNKTFLSACALLCTLTVAAQTPQDSIAFASATWETTDLGDGAECRYAQIDLFGSHQSISVASYPRRKFSTQLVHLDRTARTTSDLGKEADAEIALNGSYFNVKTFEPVTYVLLNKEVVGSTTPSEYALRTNGVIAFKDKRGRKIDIFRCDTADYARVARRYRTALAAGPVLVERGRTVEYDSQRSFHTGRHPRTLIGLRADGTVVMAVIDGRFPTGEGTTIPETAFIAKQLGLVEALNLDGGGSSTIWTARKGVLNHPYDNKRFDHEGERKVPNVLVVKK